MTALGPNEYRCNVCKGVFDKGWSDEEAKAELDSGIFGDVPVEECDVACDDCWKKMGLHHDGPKLVGDG